MTCKISSTFFIPLITHSFRPSNRPSTSPMSSEPSNPKTRNFTRLRPIPIHDQAKVSLGRISAVCMLRSPSISPNPNPPSDPMITPTVSAQVSSSSSPCPKDSPYGRPISSPTSHPFSTPLTICPHARFHDHLVFPLCLLSVSCPWISPFSSPKSAPLTSPPSTAKPRRIPKPGDDGKINDAKISPPAGPRQSAPTSPKFALSSSAFPSLGALACAEHRSQRLPVVSQRRSPLTTHLRRSPHDRPVSIRSASAASQPALVTRDHREVPDVPPPTVHPRLPGTHQPAVP